MSRYLSAAAVVIAVALAAPAEDKKDAPALKGSWTKSVDGGVEITFKFAAKDKLICVVEADGKKCTLTCESSTDKDGKVAAKVTEVSNKDFPDPPPVGYKFAFKFKVEKDTGKLSDFEADNADQVKGVVEGDYKKKGD